MLGDCIGGSRVRFFNYYGVCITNRHYCKEGALPVRGSDGRTSVWPQQSGCDGVKPARYGGRPHLRDLTGCLQSTTPAQTK